MDMYNMSQAMKEIEGRLYTFSWPNGAPIQEVYDFLTENIQAFVKIAQDHQERMEKEKDKQNVSVEVPSVE